MRSAALAFGVALLALTGAVTDAQQPPRPQPQGDSIVAAPARRANEGRGPFKTLAIRGAILIDGTGAPPVGPVDIVVEGNRIQAVRSAGTPGLPLRTGRAPEKP